MPQPLREILGATPDAVTATDIAALVAAGARETEILDFKRELYGNGDSDRRELAGDLAAFGNHRAGILLLGVDEADGVATAAPGVALSEAEEQRIHQIAAGLVVPHLPIAVHRVPSDDDPALGWYIVVVPPSLNRPHAVRVNDALRYPRRDGTRTRYLTESEVADLYRARHAQAIAETDRVGVITDEAITRIDQDNVPWVFVSLIPSGAGDFDITSESLANHQIWCRRYAGGDRISDFLSNTAPAVQPGLRRLRLTSTYGGDRPNYMYAELHTDGAAVVGHRLHPIAEDNELGQAFLDEDLTWTVVRCLNVAVEHAVHTCGAYGQALVQVRLLGERLRMGYVQWLGVTAMNRVAEDAVVVRGGLVSQREILLDEAAASRQGLLAATRLVLTDAVHAFGKSEVKHIAPGGALRIRYFPQQQHEREWAETHGIAVTDETLA